MRVVVTRDNGQLTNKQTLGKGKVIDDNGRLVFSFETLELPWLNNQHDISCIPLGEYKCTKIAATHNIPYEHISIITSRQGICIHSANYYTQLRGCIAVGKERIDINNDGVKDVTESMNTFKQLMMVTEETFDLIINVG